MIMSGLVPAGASWSPRAARASLLRAAARFGADPRIYLTTVKKFIGDESGRVKELVTVEIKWGKNDKGQFVPTEVPGTEKTRPAQLVLLAMGFLGPEQALLKDLNLETDARSNIKAEHEKYTTSIKGIFAAGDCRRGQSLVVLASPKHGVGGWADLSSVALREGGSTKAAVPPANATATSWAQPICLKLDRSRYPQHVASFQVVRLLVTVMWYVSSLFLRSKRYPVISTCSQS